jgi:hypothetical protein
MQQLSIFNTSEEPKTMNAYEQRQQERKERYEQRAADARREAEQRSTRAHQMADVIPFGQPILVGHHSEKADRNYRAKIDNQYRASYEATQKAAHYEDKAASVGTGGISSDDPDAITKLQEKLDKAQRLQDTMKAVNAIIRKHKGNASCVPLLVEAGLTEEMAIYKLKPDFAGRIGYPSYALTNNNAEINRVKDRIAALQREAQRPPAEPVETDNGITVTEEDNRVCIRFPGKPEETVRQTLKRWGFKWSPTRTAWVRMANNAGRYAAKEVLSSIT